MSEQPSERKQPSQHPLVRSGFMEYDRVVFFSDAVFAIAITLLAVNLRVPSGLDPAEQLSHAVPEMRGFVISFAVIALFWLGHHGVFRYIVALDRTLITLNLLFLGSIAFLPYPTDLLSASSNSTAATIFYASCGAFAGLCEMAIWLYAIKSPAGLVSPAAAPVGRLFLLRIARIPVFFLLSIPIAVRYPDEAFFVWILIWLSGIVINHYALRSQPAEQLD